MRYLNFNVNFFTSIRLRMQIINLVFHLQTRTYTYSERCADDFRQIRYLSIVELLLTHHAKPLEIIYER